jgi:hypothetical protein
MQTDLFDNARKALKVEDLAARFVALKRHGRELRGDCPLCGQNAKKGASKFKVDPVRQTWFCFVCERRGDVVDLYAALERMDDLAEAARRITGNAPTKVAKPREARAPEIEDAGRIARRTQLIADMWREGEPIVGSLASKYLQSRSIGLGLMHQLGNPRFHPSAPHHWDDKANVWARAPAMIGKVETPGGWTGGLHVTYLRPDGWGKSPLTPSKLMWGPQGEETPFGSRKGGLWLIGPDGPGDLVIGEGIETTLSLATWLHDQGKRELRVAAALSLNSLQGVLARDEAGTVDLWRPMADAAKRAFLWPPCDTPPTSPGSGVFVAIDRDMSPIKVTKGRTPRGRIVDFTLDGEARARLCALLVKRAWLDAGWAFVRPMLPTPGGDWNNVISKVEA